MTTTLEDAMLLAVLREAAMQTEGLPQYRYISVSDWGYDSELTFEGVPDMLQEAAGRWCKARRDQVATLIKEAEGTTRDVCYGYYWRFYFDGSIRVTLERTVSTSCEFPV